MSDTLGARIDAMFQHYIRDDFDAPESREALLVYADAAERLAVALSPLGLRICDDEPGADEVNAAMEAWWAIERGVQP